MDPKERGRKRRLRAEALLLELYRRRADVWAVQLPMERLSADLAWTSEDFDDAMGELIGDGLAHMASFTYVDLTPAGFDEAEHLIESGRLGEASDRASLLRRQSFRLATLDLAYKDLTEHGVDRLNLLNIGLLMGTDDQDRMHRIAQWLVDRDLASWVSGGALQLTREGRDVIERAEAEPGEVPATGFATYNLVFHGDVSHVNIAQGSSNVSQVITVGSGDVDGLREIMAAIQDELASIDEQQRELAATYLKVLEAEAAAGTPGSGPVRAILGTLYDWVKPITTSVAAGKILEYLRSQP